MLTARTTSKDLLIAPEGVECELRAMSRDKALTCPACERNVYFRSGSYVPHFAHYKSECTALYWETESKEHLAAKWGIYKALKKQGLPAELEHFIPETRQRADVWTVIDGQPIALEVQMSRITEAVWSERRALYRSVGIKDYWYLEFEPKWSFPDFQLALTGNPEWRNMDPDALPEDAEYASLSAQVRIISAPAPAVVAWQLDLNQNHAGHGYQGGGPLATITLPMATFRFNKGCPHPENNKLVDLGRRFLADWSTPGGFAEPFMPRRLRCPSSSVGSCRGWPHSNCPSRDDGFVVTMLRSQGISVADPRHKCVPAWWSERYISEPFSPSRLPCLSPVEACRGWPHSSCSNGDIYHHRNGAAYQRPANSSVVEHPFVDFEWLNPGDTIQGIIGEREDYVEGKSWYMRREVIDPHSGEMYYMRSCETLERDIEGLVSKKYCVITYCGSEGPWLGFGGRKEFTVEVATTHAPLNMQNQFRLMEAKANGR